MAKLITILKKQHKEIIFIFDNLTSYMLGNNVGRVDIVISIRKLKSLLTNHVKLENTTLYPKLLKLENKKARETAKKFSSEMLKIGNSIFTFFDKYINLKVSEIEKNKKFKEELKKISELVDKRINSEEKVLFPLYEKYCEKVKEEKAEKKPKSKTSKATAFNMASIKSEIEQQLKVQREPIKHISKLELKEKKSQKGEKEYVKTGVPGFDELFESGIPKGNSILVAGGAGSGKTIFCLQTLAYHASQGEKCFYMSFEESEDRLKQHMKDFGWDAEKMIKSGKLKIQRTSPFEITRNVDALLAKQKGELLIDIEPVLLPEDFKPDFIIVDSLTAVASAFTGKEDSYRVYIEQLFRFFEKLRTTTFLITETQQIPEIFSTTGVEEFLADGVIVLYNIKKGDIRESAVEVLKMRGEKHQKKIVAMQITNDGIVVYPEQEVFSEI